MGDGKVNKRRMEMISKVIIVYVGSEKKEYRTLVLKAQEQVSVRDSDTKQYRKA